MSSAAKVAIAVGHHEDAPGAALSVGRHTIHEHGLWKPFAYRLQDVVQCGKPAIHARVFERPAPNAFQDVAGEVNAYNPDACIELHHNASTNPAATGTEMVTPSDSDASRTLAKHLQAKTVRAVGLPDRGIKTVDVSILPHVRAPSVVVEPGFGSNEGDAWTVVTHLPAIMDAYAKGLCEYIF